MLDFDESTLWRISSFERYRADKGNSAFARLDGPTLLPTTLLADLTRLESQGANDDPLEVVAACMRHHEAALLCLQIDGLVWPITLFPLQQMYHSPRDPLAAQGTFFARATVLSAEPPGLRPLGHTQSERVGQRPHYRPLMPLLWALAMHSTRSALLSEIGGDAAYRATRRPADDGVSVTGALSSAVDALTRETVSLRVIASWPGMSLERARRMLNGLYLLSALRLTRGHPAARAEPGSWLQRLGGKYRR